MIGAVQYAYKQAGYYSDERRLMKILITDDEKMMRSGMEKEVKKVLSDAVVYTASSGKEALEIFGKEDISLVFLDVEMPGMNGLEVAKKLKEIKPTVNIVMTTAYPNYAVDAYRLHIGGYLLKPVVADDIQEELEHLGGGASGRHQRNLYERSSGVEMLWRVSGVVWRRAVAFFQDKIQGDTGLSHSEERRLGKQKRTPGYPVGG